LLKVIILLTDGENNRGDISPVTAAEIAQNFGIRVYTIGVGTIGQAPYPVQTMFGMQTQMMDVKIDEKTLKEISSITDGEYFRATNVAGLEQVYETIDALERTEIEIKEYTRYKELFGWFLIPALIFGMGGQTLDRTLFRRRL